MLADRIDTARSLDPALWPQVGVPGATQVIHQLAALDALRAHAASSTSPAGAARPRQRTARRAELAFDVAAGHLAGAMQHLSELLHLTLVVARQHRPPVSNQEENAQALVKRADIALRNAAVGLRVHADRLPTAVPEPVPRAVGVRAAAARLRTAIFPHAEPMTVVSLVRPVRPADPANVIPLHRGH
ncbi:hypothetical protein P3T36_003355 [Kitasatospora sp. MAP12-15]|uniref:hypothetical protein n=1 Tax=unclassified Kitasatospora TaxID=2633591 RepID=UPI002474E20E|nr:hypothetical protein [Kitasatospora sp. MAP12-44]MDH6111333.1 hypothetical protein [Kitasatospora sp. MAP12-44]